MSNDTTFTPPPVKRCSKCGAEKPLEEFGRDARHADEHLSHCRVCCKARDVVYRAAHKEELKAYRAAYNAAHLDDVKARCAAYRAAHPDEIKANNIAYHAAHREELKAYCATWRVAHPEEYRAKNAAYYAAHREESKASGAAYHATHKEELKARKAAYNAAHPDECRTRTHRRRARIRGNGVEPVSLAAIRERDKMICHLCGKKVKLSDLNFDHVIPINKGGPHAEWNVRVAHAHCNMSKHDKLIGQPYLPICSCI